MAAADDNLAFKWTGVLVGLLGVLCSGEVVLAALVLVHAWVHAIVGRWLGAPVAVWYGWGPVITDRTGEEGGWGLASLPGVFATPTPRFRAASLSRRMAVWAAGPLAALGLGLLLAWLAFTGAALEPRGHVSDWLVPERGLEVGRVMPGSAAEAAGIEVGERIRMLDGVPLRSMGQLTEAVTGGGPLELRVEGHGLERSISVQPTRTFDPVRGLARWQLGVSAADGVLVPEEVVWTQRSVGEASVEGLRTVGRFGSGVLWLFQAEVVPVGGPWGVVGSGGPRAPGVWGSLRLGELAYLSGLMTVRQLGIFVLWNLLPLPGSDALAMVDEGMRTLRGRPVPRWVGWAGLVVVGALYLALFGLVLASDAARVVGR